MRATTLKDIRLREYTIENLDILRTLRENLLKTRPEVCIERSRYTTRYLRDMSSPDEHMETRYAKAVAYFLSNKKPLFFDDNLLAGTTTSKPFGAPVYQELTGMTIWPELDTISTREKNPLILSKEDAEELNFDIFPYWMERNILEYTRKKFNNPDCMRLFERIVFFLASKAGTISHTVPDYKKVLGKGIEGIVEEARTREKELKDRGINTAEDRHSLEFYQAVQTVMKGVLEYAANLSKKAAELARVEKNHSRRETLLKMSEICARVPAKPARTFRGAIDSLWICQVAVHAENINMAISPGRL
ncbi:MAG TPA: hypothetical protein ENH17_02405, partial [Nitrospirae bacterium]|nr:hypothetical protein [Nitrospirota bacterium]